VWSSGGCVCKRFQLPSTVLQSTWCYFAYRPNVRHLCVLHEEGLNVYALPECEAYTMTFPMKVRSIWPLPTGLLIVRHRNSSCDSQSAGLFALLHPLEGKPYFQRRNSQHSLTLHKPYAPEPRPLCIRGSQGSLEGSTDLLSSQVVFSAATLPLVVMYDQSISSHTFWALRIEHSEDTTLMGNVQDESNHRQTEVLFLDCIYIEERATNHSPGPASSIFEVTTPTLLVYGRFASSPLFYS